MNLTELRKELKQVEGLGGILVTRIIDHLRNKGIQNIMLNKDTEWITDRLPEHGEEVLVQCEVRPIGRPFRHYCCVATYLYPKTEEVGCYEWESSCEYSEEDDCYYANEGWYEKIHNWNQYTHVAIEDFVIGWKPVPKEKIVN